MMEEKQWISVEEDIRVVVRQIIRRTLSRDLDEGKLWERRHKLRLGSYGNYRDKCHAISNAPCHLHIP